MTPEEYKSLQIGSVVRDMVSGQYYEITAMHNDVCSMVPAMHVDHADTYTLVSHGVVKDHGAEKVELQKGYSGASGKK